MTVIDLAANRHEQIRQHSVRFSVRTELEEIKP